MEHYTPVCIVGAGPSGATASLFLTKYNIEHVVIEKATFPRDKTCGDGLTLEVQHVLRQLSPALLNRLRQGDHADFLPSWGAKAFDPSGGCLHLDFSPNDLPYAPFYVSKRLDFDQFLVNEVKKSKLVTLLEGASLTQLKKENGKAILTGTHQGSDFLIKTNLVLAADGDNSFVEKMLANEVFRKSPACNYVSVRAYFEQVEGIDWSRRDLEFHFLKPLLPGYCWVFPVNEQSRTVNVGVIMLATDVQARKVKLRALMEEILQAEPFKKRFANAQKMGDWKGWSLPLNTHKKRLSGDGYLLLGDAGALIEPFSGKGIGIAMISGKMAAEMAQLALAQNRFDAKFLFAYHQRVYRYFRSEWKWLAIFQQLYRSALFIRVLTLMYNLPWVKATVMQRLTAFMKKWL